MELWKLLGQRMCVGLAGTEVTEELRRLVRTYKIGNVILFRANLTDAGQARALCAEIQDLVRRETGHDALIALDQEGGMVSRLPGDMITTPGAMALAATGDPKAAYEAARLTAGELRRIGVNLNLAPVLDVNSNGDNPVIGVRSYGDTPETVARFALQAVRGLLEGGVLCAGKHFPGHGDTHLDSHIALPLVDKSREQLEQTELAPFRTAIADGIQAIMSSHILFPALEPERLPATLSRRILTDLLRGEMGFDGLILSDAMEMGAIREGYGTPEGCVRALAAGVDLVFVCHETDLMERSMLAIREAHEAGRIDAAENALSVERILRIKARYPAGFAPEGSLSGADLAKRQAENAALMRRTLTCYPSPEGLLPTLGERPFVAGPLAYRSTLASTAPDTSLRFASFFATALGCEGVDLGRQPERAEVERLLLLARDATGLLLGTYNAHLNPEQLAAVQALVEAGKARGIPVIVAALRNPYDLKHIDGYARRIAAYEYSENAFQALLGALRGEYIPQGRLSVEL